MSYIPDCRTDEVYNFKNLTDKDKEFVNGFDWCLEMAVDNFFDNDMFDLADKETYLGHLLCEELPEEMQDEYEIEYSFGDRKSETRVIKTYADLIRSKILDWVEMERDELITSMIDGYPESEEE